MVYDISLLLLSLWDGCCSCLGLMSPSSWFSHSQKTHLHLCGKMHFCSLSVAVWTRRPALVGDLCLPLHVVFPPRPCGSFQPFHPPCLFLAVLPVSSLLFPRAQTLRLHEHSSIHIPVWGVRHGSVVCTSESFPEIKPRR